MMAGLTGGLQTELFGECACMCVFCEGDSARLHPMRAKLVACACKVMARQR